MNSVEENMSVDLTLAPKDPLTWIYSGIYLVKQGCMKANSNGMFLHVRNDQQPLTELVAFSICRDLSGC